MSPFDITGPSTCGPNEREKAQHGARAKRIRLEVPDAKGSNTINQFSKLSIQIGAQTDAGKRARLLKGMAI